MGGGWRRLIWVGAGTFGVTVASVAIAEPAAAPDYLPIATGTDTPTTVVVEKGDHLWSITATHLEASTGVEPNASEITPVWVEVIAANRDRLRSGDPDLIFPGEIVVLPAAG
jgi:nucleoid-associated protein YgaU